MDTGQDRQPAVIIRHGTQPINNEAKEFWEQWGRLTKAAGVATDAELAKLLNISPPSVTGAKQREAIPLKWFQTVATMFGTSLDWLILGRQGAAPKQPVQSDREPVVYPARYKTSMTKGFGYEIDARAHRLGINKAYIEQYASENAFFIRMPDNSMSPAAKRNDLLLIDPVDNYEVGSGYAIAWGDQMTVRRYDTKPGKMVFTAINERYDTIEVDITDTKNHPRLIGKVVWLAREYW